MSEKISLDSSAFKYIMCYWILQIYRYYSECHNFSINIILYSFVLLIIHAFIILCGIVA